MVGDRVNEPTFDRSSERLKFFNLSLLSLLLYSHVFARDDIDLRGDRFIDDSVDEVPDEFLPLHRAISVYVNVLKQSYCPIYHIKLLICSERHISQKLFDKFF